MYESRFTHDEIFVLFFVWFYIISFNTPCTRVQSQQYKRPFLGTEEFCFYFAFTLVCSHRFIIIIIIIIQIYTTLLIFYRKLNVFTHEILAL